MTRRVSRLNSLLKEVLSEVLTKDLHHIPGKSEFLTITSVEITADLSYAKVFISVIGDMSERQATCDALNRNAGMIAQTASRKVSMRIFPRIKFFIDEGLEKQLKICELLSKVVPPSTEDVTE
jgi:ribosome-binding factor A